MSLGPNDIVLPDMAMTRVDPPWQFAGASFEDRCTAAAAGGFAAIGLGMITRTYDEERAAGHSDADLRAMLRDAGVACAEVECFVIPGPSELGGVTEELEHSLHVADALGAERMIFSVASGLSEAEMAESFGWVCDRCAEHNVRVALEFVNNPMFSGLPDAPSALRVVQAAGRDNGGLMVDAFHHFNGTNDWSELKALPGELIVAIQLDDTAVPWPAHEHVEGTPRQRMVPGEGDADLVLFVRTMDAIGASCAYSVEVISREIVTLPPTELGERLGNASRRVLDAARAA